MIVKVFNSSSSVAQGTWQRSGSRMAGLVGGVLLAAAGMVHAQSATSTPMGDDSLTYKGITLYGIIDIGVQDQTHGAPISDFFNGGSADIVQKNSNHNIFGLTPNNDSQSRVGLQGVEPLFGQFSGVFRLETYFNPQSGQLTDALRSLTVNNGKSAASGTQTTNLDSSIAGEPFEIAYLGISSRDWGTLTFGRQLSIMADGVAKYDPNYSSYAFSLIGLSGTSAGGGDTQDRRFDNSLKYVANYLGMVHFGLNYKFNQASGGAGQAIEVNFGGEYAGLSVDAYYNKIRDAISASSLSAAQVAGLPALGYSVQNSLAATVSDNTSGAIMGLYNMGAVKLFAAYERIRFANPADSLSAGFNDLGYNLAYVTLNAFPLDKIMEVFWAGVRYSPIDQLDLVAAYYGYHQNSYGTGATAGCSTAVAGTCSGTTDAVSFDVDYRLTKRFDVYAGAMYTIVYNGQANGYAFSRNDLNPTIGLRFKF
jgi:predicted porin